MMPIVRNCITLMLYFLAVFFVFVRSGSLALSGADCQNGNFSEGFCVCAPEYTGRYCDVTINETASIDPEWCFTSAGAGFISGSGHHSVGDCESLNLARIEEICQPFSIYEVTVTWNLTTIMDSDVPIESQSLCALQIIFGDSPFVVEGVRVHGGKVRFALKTKAEFEIAEIKEKLKMGKNKSGIISQIQVQDGDECLKKHGNEVCLCTLHRHDCSSRSEMCENGGSCLVATGGALCKCPVGFSGSRCETHWASYYNVMIGLIAALLLILLVCPVLIFMTWARRRICRPVPNVTKKRRDVTGISNPYADVIMETKERLNSSDEEDRL